MLSATAIAAGGLFIAVFVRGALGLRHHELQPRPALRAPDGLGPRLRPARRRAGSTRGSSTSSRLREVGRRTRTAIVGTGEPGVALAGHIWRTAATETQVVGFVSDSPAEVGRHIEGASVLGVVEDLEELISRHGIDQVIIATPQASREEMDWIWRTSTRASAEVKVMPDLGEFLAEGAIKLRELQIEDLLGREPVDIDLDALSGLHQRPAGPRHRRERLHRQGALSPDLTPRPREARPARPRRERPLLPERGAAPRRLLRR